MTIVTLDGEMGNVFGKKFELSVISPAEAISIITANFPEFSGWVRDNLDTYEGYRVTCEYENGNTIDIGEEELCMEGRLKSIRFSPILFGSGNTFKLIAGILIIAVASFLTFGAAALMTAAAGGAAMGTGAAVGFGTAMGVGLSALGGMSTGTLLMIGAGLAIGGIIGMMSPQPSTNSDMTARKDKTSKYFSGAVNTTTQGTVVPLIYGRCLVGSHPISASVTISDEPVVSNV